MRNLSLCVHRRNLVLYYYGICRENINLAMICRIICVVYTAKKNCPEGRKTYVLDIGYFIRHNFNIGPIFIQFRKMEHQMFMSN